MAGRPDATGLTTLPDTAATTVRHTTPTREELIVMRHPTGRVLSRLLDEPAGVSLADRRHVAGCPQCLDTLAATREHPVLLDPDVPARGSGPGAEPRAGRVRGLLRRPAVAAVAVAVVLAGAGTAAANDLLQIFRTGQIAPVSITTDDLLALPDLSAYGELAVSGDPDVHEVTDAAAAAAETGLDVPLVVDLPPGVVGEPVHQVGGQAVATFTFSADRASQAAAEAGEALPPVPPGLDGSSVRLVAGPGVAQIWSSSAGAPALVVGRAAAPTAFSTGAPFETVRDYLLSLPGVPEELAAQLRAFTADGSTLPLPVPADEVRTSSAQVDDVEATVLATRDGSSTAVVWVDEGTVTVVAGSLDDDEVLSVARGLR